MNPKILLVEDDPAIVRNLAGFLTEEGWKVYAAGSRREALALLEKEAFDLTLLDISLPDGNGFTLCTLMKQEYRIPVIFLTASDDEYSVVTGLDMGADDYVMKPFRPRELMSRVRGVLRRSGKEKRELTLGGVRVDPERAKVWKYGRELTLSALEYRLLLALLSHKGGIVAREQLLEEIWDAAGEFVNDNTLTVYIKRLREKVEDEPQNPKLIRTIRGRGYQIEEPEVREKEE